MSATIDRTLAALADPKRRRAVELLGQRPHSAGELARALDLAPPAMSRHLRALKDGGLIKDSFLSFDARVRIYSLKDGATDGLRHWLAETEARWADQLAAFKAYAERGDERPE